MPARIYTPEEYRQRKNAYIIEYNRQKRLENPERRKEWDRNYYLRKKEKKRLEMLNEDNIENININIQVA
jgi:hypothetical protein